MTTIEQYLDNGGDGAELPDLVKDAHRALRAVAELHSYNSTLNQDCAECVSSDHGYECRTKAVICDALGIDGRDDTE